MKETAAYFPALGFAKDWRREHLQDNKFSRNSTKLSQSHTNRSVAKCRIFWSHSVYKYRVVNAIHFSQSISIPNSYLHSDFASRPCAW